MFTLEALRQAHAQVKTGKDFPAYVRKLIELGLDSYVYHVADGSTSYLGRDGSRLEWPARYATMHIADIGDRTKLAERIAIHQAGWSGFLELCGEVADAGVDSWKVDTRRMACIYYDRGGSEMLREDIPV